MTQGVHEGTGRCNSKQGAEAHLIPLHGMLEGLHGKVDLADVLVLHKDA